MKYFAIRDNSGNVLSYGITSAKSTDHEITEAEYLALVQETKTLDGYVDAVYSGDTTLEDVPEEYRARVDERVQAMQEADNQPEPADPEVEEALSILRGEVTE